MHRDTISRAAWIKHIGEFKNYVRPTRMPGVWELFFGVLTCLIGTKLSRVEI